MLQILFSRSSFQDYLSFLSNLFSRFSRGFFSLFFSGFFCLLFRGFFHRFFRGFSFVDSLLSTASQEILAERSPLSRRYRTGVQRYRVLPSRRRSWCNPFTPVRRAAASKRRTAYYFYRSRNLGI